MFRYRELLPLPMDAALLPLSVGGTPLVNARRLAKDIGVAELYLKDEGRNPSASLKDRPSSLAVAMAMAVGAERISCASTGNAASSTACAAASVGMGASIFVPRRAPSPKVAQLRIFGADVYRVAADYDTTWDLAFAVAEKKPWFNRNCAVNPYLLEGKKTCALEIAEELGEFDWLVYSVGDGCTIAGGVKGLEEAMAAGWCKKQPRVLGVQAQGAAPLAKAFREGGGFVQKSADTFADSIAVAHPRNGHKAIDYVRRNGGAYVTVSDDEIYRAMVDTAQKGGVFGEPAAAAATAGVRQAVAEGIIDGDAKVVVVVSGNGLKDTESALSAVTGPVDVQAELAHILAAINQSPE